MADLAQEWGWGPDVMDPMTPAELLGWHRKAARRADARARANRS